MQKKEPYVIPELRLVGHSNEVVLGSTGIGFDFVGERMPAGMEFETDDGPNTNSH
jgi:hypothetical protein